MRAKRKVVLGETDNVLEKLNPLPYISAGALYVYQNIVSEQLQATCTYHISCSEFTKLSIAKNGFLRGLLSGFDQLGNCSGHIINDHPSWMITDDGVIDNRSYLED